MKKICLRMALLAVCLFSIATQVFAANWQVACEYDTGISYVDIDSVKTDYKGTVSFWQKIVLKTDSPETEMKIGDYFLYLHEAGQYKDMLLGRNLLESAYDKNGNFMWNSQPIGWRAIAPGSIQERTIIFAAKHVRNKI